MSWDVFIWFAAASVILWALGAVQAWIGKRSSAIINYGLGILVFFSFILAFFEYEV